MTKEDIFKENKTITVLFRIKKRFKISDTFNELGLEILIFKRLVENIIGIEIRGINSQYCLYRSKNRVWERYQGDEQYIELQILQCYGEPWSLMFLWDRVDK